MKAPLRRPQPRRARNFLKSYQDGLSGPAIMAKDRQRKAQNSYEGIRIVPCERKGEKVVSTELLLPGFCFPYGGIPVTLAEVKALRKNPQRHDGCGEYIIVSEYSSDGAKEIAWLDAHKSKMPTSLPRDAWIGSKVNQPSPGEQTNARFIEISNPLHLKAHLKNYPHLHGSMTVFVEVTRTIEAGEEVLCDYFFEDKYYRRLHYDTRKLINMNNETNQADTIARNRKQRSISRVNYAELNTIGRNY